VSGRDLLFQDEIRAAVLKAYAEVPSGAGEPVAGALYSREELAEVPQGAIDWALGVGNPIRYALLEAGQTVLDVGSGGGIDTILAAKRVGPYGRAIGLDPLPDMLERARTHAEQAGVASWTEFVDGDMEAIPLPDASVDVVVSNGVINLSARKGRAMAEIHRILRPGGRVCVADLTVEEELPPEIAASDAAWAG
jgi:arsenite methyltransferase